MRKQGIASIVIATETFKTLVLAQAKARKIDPHLIVVRHPVGGLNAEELKDRIEAAYAGLEAEMKG